MKNPTIEQSLPGIVKVGWLDCEKLQPNLRDLAAAGVPVAAHTAVTLVPLAADATCELASEMQKGAVVQTATLKFRTSQYIPVEVQLGFVVTDVQGESWLIGAAEPPFPQVKLTRKSRTPSGDPAVWDIEVKAVGQRALLPCVY